MKAQVMKVLYVEDNPADADLVRRALARQAPGVRLELAPTLAVATARLAQAPAFDLVLSDLALPDGNGLELLVHIRFHQLPLAVVMLTGSGDQESAIAALKSGADDYVIKSDSYLARLPDTLATALARFHAAAMRKAKPLRVLYVEHNPFDADLTQRHLAQHTPHIRLDVVGNATEMLARLPDGAAQAPDFDVLLLDYRLPGLDALELVKILRQERGLKLPIVLVTSHGSEQVAAQALRLGVDDYLTKNAGYLYALPATLEKAQRQVELEQQQAALSESHQRYGELVARIPVGVYRQRALKGGGLRFEYASPPFCAMLQLDLATLLDRADAALAHLHHDDVAALAQAQQAAQQHLQALTWEGRFYIGTELRWFRLEATPTPMDNGDTLWDGVQTDITEQKRAEKELRQSAMVFESTRDGIFVTDLQANILSVNQAFTQITGYSEAEVLGHNPRLLQSGRHERSFYQALWANVLELGHWQGELWNRRKNGEIYPLWLSISTMLDGQGQPSRYVAVASDISQIKQGEEKLERLAHYDALTQLPNRLLLFSRLAHGLEQAQRNQNMLALLMLDLDHFKDVNDSFGHLAGDGLLQQVAQRLSARFRGVDTICRLGGDEFTVLLERVTRAEDAARVASEIITDLSQPWQLANGAEVRLGVSIGISLYPMHGTTPEVLLQQADTALYQAKSEGRGCFKYFSEQLTNAVRTRMDIEVRLRRALAQQELRVFYQPQVDIASGRIVGAEALVRWQDPQEGLISPAYFIRVAEDTGLISPIGNWVLQEACRQGQRWLVAGLPPLRMAVNLSSHQFLHSDIKVVVAAALQQSGFPAAWLELELTESALMEREKEGIEILEQLRTLGVKLAIDDFGTDYSSLAYLKRFPLDVLKIDKSFVDDLSHDSNDQAIAATIIAMAHTLRLKALAEGVETQQQLEFLQSQGCDMYQGYLVSPPLPADQFARLLLSHVAAPQP